MKEKLKKMFKGWFLPYDWKIMWTDSCEWNVQTSYGKQTEYALYEIFYSPARDSYRLEISGEKPKFQYMYKQAIEMLKMYNEVGETEQPPVK